MKCEKCGKYEANTYYEENINGQVKHMHLCADCASNMHINQSFAPLLSNFFDFVPAAVYAQPRQCPVCGQTENTLRQSGTVGCAHCYDTFSDILLPYIRQIHGADRHICADTSAPNPVASLKQQLSQAISSENYEEAARLRDEIRRMEG